MYDQVLKLRSQLVRRPKPEPKLNIDYSQPTIDLKQQRKLLVSLNKSREEEAKKSRMALHLKRKSQQYSKVVKNVHFPKISPRKQLELDLVKEKLLPTKPLQPLEKPIDYLHTSRNK